MEDEDIIRSTMDSLNEIARVSYDFIRDYIDKIGALTTRLIASEHDVAAKLAIEIWSTIADVENTRQQMN